MRIAVCQMRSGAEVGANLEEADRLLKESADVGADVTILPELFPYLGPRSGVPSAGGLGNPRTLADQRDHGVIARTRPTRGLGLLWTIAETDNVYE